jgi:transketolase
VGTEAIPTATWKNTPEFKAVTAIRTLAMDAVQQANSGHPGTPVAMAPVTYTLWQRFLRFDPSDPIWPNRDRFVLSMGHASMLLYSMLHLTEVKAVNAKYEKVDKPTVCLDDIKKFRQMDSRCPGHPEYRWTSGIETTTGPLGQGVATSVGMAMAGKWQAAYFNKPGLEMFDYDVYALCGDGCMMEGVSGEAGSLAGHLKLDNLCWIYDNNHITIEGNTNVAFTEDVATRFIAYGWNVTRVGDANDLDMLSRAFKTFKETTGRPTLIIVDSHIAWGVPGKEGHHSAHGEPLGWKAIVQAKQFYGCTFKDKAPPADSTDAKDPAWKVGLFENCMADGVYEHFREGIGKRGRELREAWFAKLAEYTKKHPQLADHMARMQRRELPEGWDKDLTEYPPDPKGKAGRIASNEVLNKIAPRVPWLLGGSADLAPSTKTLMKDVGDFQAGNYGGRNLHFGIREHAMGSILNGLSLSKVRPYGSGFLIFSDYGRNPIRLASIMEIPVLYIFTHDSIGVGEDGPTHQPIEQVASLRAIPGLITLRPCDSNEVVEAWRVIMKSQHEPICLILTRQDLPTLDRKKYAPASGLAKGAYVLADAEGGKPEVILMATGSEVSLCVDVYEQLKKEGIKARVVSMPSWEMFEHYCKHHPEYREQVLPSSVMARVAVEQAAAFGWHQYVGCDGGIVAMRTFGASAPLKELQKKFGFTPDRIVEEAKKQIGMHKK